MIEVWAHAGQRRERTVLLDQVARFNAAQGTYHGRLWSVGTFNSGPGLYADRTRLDRAGIRIPTLACAMPMSS